MGNPAPHRRLLVDSLKTLIPDAWRNMEQSHESEQVGDTEVHMEDFYSYLSFSERANAATNIYNRVSTVLYELPCDVPIYRITI